MLHNMGGVTCQPFLKHSNHWKRAPKMIFKESGCFQFPKAVVTSTAKESLRLFRYTFMNTDMNQFLIEI